MRVQSMLAVGVLLMMVGIGVVNAADSDIAAANRAAGLARIGHGGSTYDSSERDRTDDFHGRGEERKKVDVIERIGQGGSTYSFWQPKSAQSGDSHGEGRRADIEERIGHGGSTYSSS